MSYPQQPDSQSWAQQRQPSYAPGHQVQPQQHAAPPYQPPGYPPPAQQGRRAVKRYALRGAETFWYVLGCVDLGAAYFAKIPVKKAASEILSELQLDGHGPSHGYSLNGAEGFWYILLCLPFGAAYFSKISAKKAMWELVTVLQSAPGQNTEAVFRALSGTAAPAAY